MSDSDLQQTVSRFNRLVANFEYATALRTFYHPGVVKHENENAPTIGLKNFEREMQSFLASISHRSAELLRVIVSDGISVVEWHYRFTHDQWGSKDFRQVSIQRWKDGKIIHERHLYGTEEW